MNKITFGNTYAVIQKITPPRLLSALKKTRIYRIASDTAKKCLPSDYHPSWQTILSGPLKGCELYVDPSGEWQSQMLNGTYDDFFFKFLENIDLTGKTAFDVGAHLGFHTLHFAQKVGPSGSAVAFEPNPINIQRLQMIVEHNKDIAKRITLIKKAISDKKGSISFLCADIIEDGSSCGGFIEGSDTFYEKSSYEEKRGFRPITVETISLDEIVQSGMVKKPDIIKIDIEGAEYLALKGAVSIIKKYSPILLIEIHSKFNNENIYPLLKDLRYNITVLKKESGDRCFIAALPK
ncbi:MAG: FkbM family methyltransferase [Candidatus Taylorbacteria bacterium]